MCPKHSVSGLQDSLCAAFHAGALVDRLEPAACAKVADALGELAAVVPRAPHAPLANTAVAPHGGIDAAALRDLDAAFRDAGVTVWHLWLPTHDHASHDVALRAGYRYHDTVPAMVLDLAAYDPPDLDGLDWDDSAPMATLGTINQIAQADGGGLTAALERDLLDRPEVRMYQARLNGQPVAALCTIDHDHPHLGRDCGAQFLATLPSARRRGLAHRLLGAALRDARARGCATSTLHSSRAGLPLYLRMGYDLAALVTVFERRVDH